jgi:hypothetical protein
MIRGWCFTRLERRRWNIVPADATIPERQKSSTDDSPTKKAAPARGKPKAGTAEVANAQTQLPTNGTLYGVSGALTSICSVLHRRDAATVLPQQM